METIKLKDFREISKILKKEFPDYLESEEDFYNELKESKINSSISRKEVDADGNIISLLLFTDLSIYEEVPFTVPASSKFDAKNKISSIKGIYLLWVDEKYRGQGKARDYINYIKDLKTSFWIPVLNKLNTHELWKNKLGVTKFLEYDNCKYYYYESSSN